jgi:SAM-dependent methyltransferase
MAERWAEFLTDAPELEYLRQSIIRFGQPALDVACGTGRLLIPLLRSGIDVDGCDISQDMLDQCRRRAAQEGLRTQLLQQPMHAFESSRRYRTIYVCGSFGLAGSREKDLAALRRCYSHLIDDGALLLNIEAEYNDVQAWSMWLPQNRHALPELWPEEGRPQVASDGSEHRATFRMLALDPLEQTYVRQVRLEKWVSGELVASEERTLRGNMYLKNEVLLMLRLAGFRAVTVTGDYTEEPASPEHRELVFTAIK